jgi:ribosomal-protein-alanine N-acetyltransferase
MTHAPETIQTARLLLRKPLPGDVPAVLRAYAHDPEVTRYLLWRPDQTPEEIAAFVARALEAWERGTTYTWAITLRESGRLIGMIDARVDAYMANIGYVLAKAHWNEGYTTEALKAVLAWTDTQEELERVWAVCAVANPSSARVMEKAGMEREGILRRWMIFPNIGGTPLDCYSYARVRDAESR